MIRLDRNGGVWTVTLDRPDKANALTRGMLGDLVSIAEDAHEARALVITGAGGVFSAGADLDEARSGLASDPVWEELSGAVAGLRCMTVAALNGTVAGGAFGMVLACDLRVAVSSARFFYPVMRLGFLPQPSDPARLRALVGPARAKSILMAGRKLSADEALRIGLVDLVADDAVAAARELVADAVSAAPAHVAAIKDMIAP